MRTFLLVFFFLMLLGETNASVTRDRSSAHRKNNTQWRTHRTVPASPLLRSDSLEFPGLSAALGKIFSEEKIQSILSKLPLNCKIYGYDIGDYSGDDGMDVVLSTRDEEQRGRVMDVHFFLNDGPEFRLVKSLQRRFVLEPIEVGFSIEQGRAFVTEKTGEFGWRITGYSVESGVFRRVSQWITDRMPYQGQRTAVGFDRGHDLRSNLIDEHFFGTNTNRTFLRQKYYDLPLFREGADLPSNINRQIGDSSALMIVRGGSSWHGPEDCSIFCSGEYDSTSVTLSVTVHDDRLLYTGVMDSSDHVILSFDFSRKTRIRPGGDAQRWSPNTRLDLLIIMGDGQQRTPVVELRGEELASVHGHDIAVTMEADATQFQVYRFSVRLPIALFEHKGMPGAAGFVCSYHDVDYPANLSWVSVVSTARGYAPDAPETWGRVHFVRDVREHYEWDDLHTRDLSKELRRVGVLP